MRKDYSRIPGEQICTWLLQCWDSGAAGLELEGREAKQLGPLAKQAGIDKVSWFNQDRVKFPQQWGGALAGLFRYHADVTSWQVTFSWRERGALVVLYIVLPTAVFGRYFALFIAITITVIVIVVVGCVAIALLY